MKVIKGGKDKSKPKTKRKPFDREAIGKDIAAGLLSIREIARKHGCSPAYVFKIKTEEGIERDLSIRVRQKIRAKLVNKKPKVYSKVVTKKVTAKDKRTKKEQEKFENEAIEEAAKEGVEIISRHRSIIERCTTVVNKFLNELKKDKVLMKVTDKGKKIYGKIPATQKATLFNSVTIAASRLIPLERQSYNLDAESPKIPTGEESAITDYPAGPLTLADWEKQMRDAEAKREKTNTDTGS